METESLPDLHGPVHTFASQSKCMTEKPSKKRKGRAEIGDEVNKSQYDRLVNWKHKVVSCGNVCKEMFLNWATPSYPRETNSIDLKQESFFARADLVFLGQCLGDTKSRIYFIYCIFWINRAE